MSYMTPLYHRYYSERDADACILSGAATTQCARVTCVDLHGAFLQGKARWDKQRGEEQVTPLGARLLSDSHRALHFKCCFTVHPNGTYSVKLVVISPTRLWYSVCSYGNLTSLSLRVSVVFISRIKLTRVSALVLSILAELTLLVLD